MEQKSNLTTKVIVIAISAFALLFIIANIIQMRNNAPRYYDTSVISDTLIIDTSASSTDTTTIASTEPPEIPTNWYYQNDVDEMTDKDITIASIEANEKLIFDFPYDGGSTATFSIRKNGKKLDIFLRVSKGQFMDTSLGGKVLIKFDKQTAQQYSYVGAEDHSSDIIFFNNEQKILNKIRKSKKMLIAATFFNEGNHVITFDTEGLDF